MLHFTAGKMVNTTLHCQMYLLVEHICQSSSLLLLLLLLLDICPYRDTLRCFILWPLPSRNFCTVYRLPSVNLCLLVFFILFFFQQIHDRLPFLRCGLSDLNCSDVGLDFTGQFSLNVDFANA